MRTASATRRRTLPLPTADTFRRAVEHPLSILVVGIILVALHGFFSAPQYALTARLLAAGLGTLSYAIIRRASREKLPFMAFAALQMYIFFGLATLWDQELVALDGPVYLSQQGLTLAVLSALVALACMFAGSILGSAVGRRLRGPFAYLLPPSEPGPRFTVAVRGWALFAFVVHFFVALRRPDIPAAFVYPAALMASPALTQALLYQDFRRSGAQVSRVWFWGFTIAVASLGLMKGMLAGTLTPLLTAIFLSWAFGHDLRARSAILLVLLFFLLNPAKHVFRAELAGSSEASTLTDRMSLWREAITETWLEPSKETEENIDQTTNRLSALLYVAQTIEWVPDQVPEAGVERWFAVPASYIPRFVWPDKPDLTRLYNAEYGITFRLQTTKSIETTAINLPQMSDAYWSLGWTGIVLIAASVGLLLGFYREIFSQPQRWSAIAIGVAFLVAVVPHAHVAQHFGGVLQRLFVYLAVIWVVFLLSYGRIVRRGRSTEFGR